jgi:hypothetical protein
MLETVEPAALVFDPLAQRVPIELRVGEVLEEDILPPASIDAREVATKDS